MPLRAYLLPLLFVLLAYLPRAEAAVWIVVSEGSKEYAQAAEIIREQLKRDDSVGTEVLIKSVADIAQTGFSSVSLFISLGSPALQKLADATAAGRIGRTPVLASLVPRAAVEAQRQRLPVALTAIVFDQPLPRQAALLRYAFPHMHKIGVILGPDSMRQQMALEKAIVELGMQLKVYKVESEGALYPALQRVLDENDVLLAVPDAAVYNGGTIQNVLLASYRHKVPLMGFSPAYVRAGALLALYSTPTQMANQTIRVAKRLIDGVPTAAMQSPVEFVVDINSNVARSLGLRLNEDALRIQLQSREGV